ncbi:MAG: 50S ribosomal protein L3 [Bacteroidetes bacterium]|nr:50S ribosomal protein L3 [Bacteroidota bacterium]
MAALLGRKIGMTGIFNEQGVYIPCTLIETGPCTVVQVKTQENDGYEALQLGFGSKSARNVNKPEMGHLKKVGATPVRELREFRTFDVANFKPGDVIAVGDVFAVGDKVRVTATSKGHGFQGVMKRHHFGGVGMQTHGQSDRQRAPGSIGGSSYPSRVFPGTRMAGRMGGKRSTVRNLQVVAVLAEKNVLVVKGAIPGAPNSIVEIVKH